MASTHTNGASVRPAHAVHTGAGAATTSAAPLAGSPAATSNNLTGAKRSAPEAEAGASAPASAKQRTGAAAADSGASDATGAGAEAAAEAAKAKQKAKLKALMAKFPLTSCTSSDNHLLCPVHTEDGQRKPLTGIMKGVNPVIIVAVQQTKLPPLLAELRAQYAKFGKRNPFLWQWLYYSTQLMAGDTIAPEHADAVTLVKSLINMFNVVTDDIGDEDNDIKLLHRIEADLFRNLPTAQPDGGDESKSDASRSRSSSVCSSTDPKAVFCHTLKHHLWEQAAKLPRFRELEEVLEYDIRQMLNEKRYSALTNKHPSIINRTEHSLVAPHTMHAMIFLTCDLMASPGVDTKEFGMLRSIYWDANVMANLANCLGTWAREIPKRDWSSPLFPQAIEDGLFTIDDLNSLPVDEIKARIEASPVEGKLLARWYDHYDHIMSLDAKITCSSAAKFAVKNEAFLAMHLACRGFI